jgi:hypothetical protein
MENSKEEKRKLLIEKLRKIKNIPLEQAKQLLETLETYCELIIYYTLNNPDEQD